MVAKSNLSHTLRTLVAGARVVTDRQTDRHTQTDYTITLVRMHAEH